MSGGLINAAACAPAVIDTPAAGTFTLFNDSSNSNIPSLMDSARAVVGLGGLTQEQIEDFLGTSTLLTSTEVAWSYNDPTGKITAALVDGSIVNARLANMVQATFKMRAAAAGTGPPIDGTIAQAKAALALASTDLSDFTEAAQDAAGALFADSKSIDVTYDDAGNAESGEVIIAVQAQVSATSKVFAVGDLEKWWSRVNGGVAMTDTLPVMSAATNGQYLIVSNDDATAAITIGAGAGQTFVSALGVAGAGSFTLKAGRRTQFVWNNTGAFWRLFSNNNNLTKGKSGSTFTLGNLVKSSTNSDGSEIDDAGVATSIDGTFAANSDAKLPTEKAVTTYVSNAIAAAVAGLPSRDLCNYATAAPLPAVVYNNGASGVGATLTCVSVGVLTIDGAAPTLGQSILVKDQVSTFQNGIYTVTTLGTALVAAILTRRSDFDTGAEMQTSVLVPIDDQGGTPGTNNDDKVFLSLTSSPFTVGTTGITFQVIGQVYIADGSTLELVGNSFREKDAGTTNAKLANMGDGTIKGRALAAGTGVPVDLTPAQVRTLAGLVIGTNVEAWDADLDTIAGLTATTDNFIQAKASAWSSRTPTQVTNDLIGAGASQQGVVTTGAQTWAGIKNPRDLRPKNMYGTLFVDAVNTNGWAGADIGAWINDAYAFGKTTYTANYGVRIVIEAGQHNYSTPIVCATVGFSLILEGAGDGNGGTVLNYTPSTATIAINVAGGSGNDGGIQLRNFTLTGAAAGSGATGIKWGTGSVGIAGATMENVSIRRFTVGEDWQGSSLAYAICHINAKVQQCTTGVKPLGENNVWFQGLIGGNATGVDLVGVAESQMFGVAFDDNTTVAISQTNSLARTTLAGCRFENVGGGTDLYITQSAGAIAVYGGGMQSDITTGTSTGFANLSGGVFTLKDTWLLGQGSRVFTQAFNTSGTVLARIDPVIAPTSVGITTVTTAGYAGAPRRPDWVRLSNSNAAAQSLTPTAATPFYLTSSNLNIPNPIAVGPQIGTELEWDFTLQKAANGTGNVSVILYRGANASTADTADVTQIINPVAPTAAVDTVNIRVKLVFTAVGASGSYFWSIVVVSHTQTNAVGWSAPGITTVPFTGTVSGVNTLTAGVKYGIGVVLAAGGTLPVVTVPWVRAEAKNLD